MSITFAVPDAPTRMAPCEFCAWEREHWQRWVDTYQPGVHTSPPPATPPLCQPWGCSGERPVSDAPGANFGNGNALDLLAMLGIEPDSCGTIADPSATLREVVRLVNVDQRRAPYVHEGADEGGVTTCRIITAPNPDSSILRRLHALQAVLVYAVDHGYTVSWG